VSFKIALTTPMQRERIKTCANCGNDFEKDPRNTWAYWAKAKYCNQDCAGEAWSLEAASNRASMRETFERWIDKSQECWLWTGALDKDGYGAFSYAGKTRRAPGVALELDGRKPPPGQFACHHCDNPRCVRPSHLYVGTPASNVRDMVERGRNQRGSEHYAARLTDGDVLAIRASSEADLALSVRYGVSRSNITLIRLRKTWRHLP